MTSCTLKTTLAIVSYFPRTVKGRFLSCSQSLCQSTYALEGGLKGITVCELANLSLSFSVNLHGIVSTVRPYKVQLILTLPAKIDASIWTQEKLYKDEGMYQLV